MASEIKNILFLIIIAVFACVYYMDVRTLPEPEERNLVMILVWGLVVLLVIETGRSLFRGWKKNREEKTFFFQDVKDWIKSRQALLFFSVILYVIFIPIIGFFVTSLLFVIVLNIFLESRKVWELTIIPIGLLVLIYVLFVVFLGVDLPRGFLV